MSCDHIKTGDKGQRYEVRAYDYETGDLRVIGWTDQKDGGGLLSGAKIWPAVRDAHVIDRQANHLALVKE